MIKIFSLVKFCDNKEKILSLHKILSQIRIIIEYGNKNAAKFEETRARLIKDVNEIFTPSDRQFLISLEKGEPEWNGYEFSYFQDYPSVQWKILNIKKLAKQNFKKLENEIEKLRMVLSSK